MTYDEIKIEYKKIETELSDSANFSDAKKMAELNKKFSELKSPYDKIIGLEKIKNAIKENKDIVANEPSFAKATVDKADEELKKMAEEELIELKEKKKTLEIEINEELNPKNPADKKNAIIEIRAGTGGDESALFASTLYSMYVKYAEKNNYKVSIVSSNQTNIGGFKEVVFEVTGTNVYGNFKYESGTHRVQRVPETEKQGRVHTSAVTVAVFPEAEEVDLEIKPEDLRFDIFRSSGPGGQSVNTTDSAVRITHIPTGTVVSSQDQKSQQQNKIKGMQVLRSRILANVEAERHAKEAAARKEQVGTGDRSEKIRTYNFPQDRITDHRIKKSWHTIDRILAGDMEVMISELKKTL